MEHIYLCAIKNFTISTKVTENLVFSEKTVYFENEIWYITVSYLIFTRRFLKNGNCYYYRNVQEGI